MVFKIYRHNELDLPSITSPLMYEKIAARKSVPQLYEQKLIVRTFIHGQQRLLFIFVCVCSRKKY